MKDTFVRPNHIHSVGKNRNSRERAHCCLWGKPQCMVVSWYFLKSTCKLTKHLIGNLKKKTSYFNLKFSTKLHTAHPSRFLVY